MCKMVKKKKNLPCKTHWTVAGIAHIALPACKAMRGKHWGSACLTDRCMS